MKVNEKTALLTSQVLLVPYEAHHVLKYHGWMQDPAIQEATASEPMSLEEEYENQQSWRTANDKLTFIVCEPLEATQQEKDIGLLPARDADRDDRMRGDINFFLYPDEDAEEEGSDKRLLVGEVDVMIAETGHRGKGRGEASVRTLLVYIQNHLREMIEEHAAGEKQGEVGLSGLMAKIKEGNAASRALFKKLGFTQKGEVNYFGEVLMVMDWSDVVGQQWLEAAADYREVGYGGLVA